MRNLNIICIEKDFVAWPCPGKTINLSDSRENQSNAILDQIQDFIGNSHDDPNLKKYRQEFFLN